MKLIRNYILTWVLIVFPMVSLFGQEIYDNCTDAYRMCPGTTVSFNNIDATVNNCPGCEDDNIVCFLPTNTIWITFVTNSTGGDVDIDFTNLVFVVEPGRALQLQAVVYDVGAACDPSTYTPIAGTCVNNETSDFTISASGLQPSTAYYLMINGNAFGAGITLAAEATFDLRISGSGFDFPEPDVDLTPGTMPFCEGQSFTATAVLNDCENNSPIQWYVNNTLVQSSLSTTYTSNGLKNGDQIHFSVMCSGECLDSSFSDTVTINVIAVTSFAGDDITILPGSNTQLNATVQGSQFEWVPSSNLSNPASTNPVASPTESTEYFLTVTEGGCIAIDSVWVFVEDRVTIPKVFTPNNDNINDVWEIRNVTNFPNNYVVVYDRWGQKVYEATSYGTDKFWNGLNRAENRLVPAGTYYYVLELRDEEQTVYRGSVTVIY